LTFFPRDEEIRPTERRLDYPTDRVTVENAVTDLQAEKRGGFDIHEEKIHPMKPLWLII
jgi:hypothetical protein